MVGTAFQTENFIGKDAGRIDAEICGLLTSVTQFSGADRAHILIDTDGALTFHASACRENGAVTAGPVHTADAAEQEKIRAVCDYAARHGSFGLTDRRSSDAKAVASAPYSTEGQGAVLCLPIPTTGERAAFLYLEIKSAEPGFQPHVGEALGLFCQPLAIVLRMKLLSGREAVDDGLRRPPADTGSVRLDPVVLNAATETIATALNDPVSAIVAHASAGLQWLSQEPPKVEKARRSLRNIAASAFAMAGVISARRAMTSRKPDIISDIDLEKLVAQVLQGLAPDLLACGVSTHCDIAPGTCITADEKQIEQAITNLIGVAVDALKETDRVRNLHISAGQEDGYVVLKLSDTGATIPLQARDAAFDPHYSSSEGNRGIRLAIARTIAQLHGGNLDMSRSDSNGTTMILSLPVPG